MYTIFLLGKITTAVFNSISSSRIKKLLFAMFFQVLMLLNVMHKPSRADFMVLSKFLPQLNTTSLEFSVNFLGIFLSGI